MSRILLVDDEARIAKVAQTCLERDGHLVVWRITAQGGLDEFVRQRPDLIVLDLMLPGMPVQELCGLIRRQSDVPIIMLTRAIPRKTRCPACSKEPTTTSPSRSVRVSPAARVRALLRRSRAVEEPQADVLVRAGGRLCIDTARRQVLLDSDEVALTESEFRLLGLSQFTAYAKRSRGATPWAPVNAARVLPEYGWGSRQ